MKTITKQLFTLLISAIFALSLAACGSDSKSGGTEASATLSGTAATGAAMEGTVFVDGANGARVSVVINPDGSFSVDVTNLTAPFALQAVPNDANLPTQYSFAAQANVTVNITPFTTLAMFLAHNQQNLDALVQDWANQSAQITTDAIATTKAQVNANFSPQFTANGLDPATYDFFSSVFSVGDAFDALLDLIQVNIDMAAGSFNVTVGGAAFTFDININIGGGAGGGTSIAITVGNGLTPAFSWTGGNVSSLTVVRTSAATSPVWGITTVGADGLASPVTHGQVPAAALETSATELTLTAGVQYRVSVTRLDGSFGFTDFTPAGGGSGATFTVSGAVSGATSNLTLQINGAGNLSVPGLSFAFQIAFADGAVYQVTVLIPPTGQNCTVSNGSGTISAANVTNVAIACSDTGGTGGGAGAAITVGSGLTPTYSWSGGNVQMISVARASDPTNPVWQFTRAGDGMASPIRHGEFRLGGVIQSSKELVLTPGVQYQVKFLRTPATISSPVDFTPSGSASAFTVGGSLSGAGVGVTRPNNFFSLIITRADGNLSFFSPFVDGTSYILPMNFVSGESYDVTIRFHPPGKTCTVANGSGTVSGANVSNVSITCVSTGSKTLSGTIINPGALVGQWELFIDDVFVNDGPLTDGPVTFTTSPVSNSAWFEIRISNTACTLPFRIPAENWVANFIPLLYKIDCS